jgi:hypothetical protein
LVVRLVIPWVAGIYHQDRSTLYVSRGTGFWGPPMRLFAPAEITEITLRSGPISIEAPAPAEAAKEPAAIPATAIPAAPITARS